MAEKIVQFREDFPILGSVPIADASKGFESYAQVAGDVAEFAGKKVASMEEQKSNFMLMEANNQAEDLKTNTKIAIKQNPDQAESILTAYNSTAASIKQNTSVNATDRSKLNSLLNTDNNELKMTASSETLRSQKRNAEIKLWGGYQTSMKAVQDAVDSGDMKLAKQLSETVVGNFKSAAYADVVSAQQYANVLKGVGLLYDRAEQLHNLAMNPDTDAQAFHRIYPSPFDNDSTDNSKLPVNHSTVYLHADGMNDKTMGGVERAILNNEKIPFSTAAKSDENFAKTLQWLAGKNEATALIDSGNKFKIDTRMSDLETKASKSPREEMEYRYLKQYQDRLLHGDSQRLMAETPLGSRIVQDFNDRLNALKVGGYSQAEQQKLTRDSYNHMIDSSISYWDAQHIDPHLNQPIPPEIVAPMAQAFKLNGDANVALERMSYMDNYQKQAYAARAMPTPVQRETMQTIALANNSIGVRPEWKRTLIEAQQPNQSKELMLEKNDPKKIKSEITSQLSDVVSYLSIGTDKNEPRGQAMVTMLYNKVIYDGVRNGDFSLANKDEYIKDAVDNMRMAYNIHNGMSSTANLTQLNISQADWSYISRHEQAEVYKNLYNSRTHSEVSAAVDRNPLRTVLTQTNQVVVMDGYGNVLSSHPYSEKLRMNAIHDTQSEDVEAMRRQNISQTARGGLLSGKGY